MRLIDADPFVAERRKQYCENCDRRKNSKGKVVYEIGGVPCRACYIGDVIDDVDCAPTVDAVPVNEYRRVEFFTAEKIFEAFFPIKLNLDTVNRIEIGNEKFVSVVRCKDCRWGKEACGNIECNVDLNLPSEYHGYEWFCPNGKRKDDE